MAVSHEESLIREYYRRIDAGDVEWVIGLFAPDATYDRAGAIYQGQPAIRRFYQTERRIAVTHSRVRCWTIEREVFVEGAFTGTGEDGSERRGEFADHWTLDEQGKVIRRRTSLFSGSDYVRR